MGSFREMSMKDISPTYTRGFFHAVSVDMEKPFQVVGKQPDIAGHP